MRFPSATALFVLVVCSATLNHASEVSIVVPNELADQEGDQTATFDADFPNGLRSQDVFPATEFAGLPDGGAWLTEMRFRPDSNVTAPRTHSFDRWFLTASTTDKTPETLSLEFAENISPNGTVVYDGPITLSTAAGGPPTGPRPFDYRIRFETPFFYDPARGNLLLDNTQTPGQWIRGDAHIGALGERGVGSFNPAASTGERFATSVVEFIFVPEPSTGMLAALAVLAICVRHSRE